MTLSYRNPDEDMLNQQYFILTGMYERLEPYIEFTIRNDIDIRSDLPASRYDTVRDTRNRRRTDSELYGSLIITEDGLDLFDG